MENKAFIIVLTISFNGIYALEIPKSSLETVRNNTRMQLEDAQKENDTIAIQKHQAELESLNQKIKRFELEWLEYRKSYLMTKAPDATISAEIQEIDQLIAARK